MMHFSPSPENQARLEWLSAQTGRPPEALMDDAVTGYLDRLAEVRQTLNSRYDDLKSGRVKPISPEEMHARLAKKHNLDPL
jgi:hypothetical protein